MLLSSVMTLAIAGAAFAEDTLTFTSWGGAYTKSQEEAFFKPFSKETGTNILQDECDCSTAKLKGMQFKSIMVVPLFVVAFAKE
ncbi:hypothetical protein ACC754_41305, partial [Rhizobium johnstonii]